MTTYRHPYNRKNRPSEFEQPPIGDWILAKRTYSCEYWRKMYFATPPWLSDSQVARMRRIYESANPKFEHIDHIVPLKSNLVCGLNVPWNLQVVPIKQNLSKSNFHWPDHPNESHELGLGEFSPYQMSLV